MKYMHNRRFVVSRIANARAGDLAETRPQTVREASAASEKGLPMGSREGAGPDG
jgi:hypothetical protein